jgi:hypothetical protein
MLIETPSANGTGMNKKYIVRLTPLDRAKLNGLVRRGKGTAYRIRHAGILLKVDQGSAAWSDETVAEAYHCHINTVRNVRQRFVRYGLDEALGRKESTGASKRRKLDVHGETALISATEQLPPDGKDYWTLGELAKHLVDSGVVDSIHPSTIHRVLARNALLPHAKKAR